MAPEALKAGYDKKADVFSFGVVICMWKLLMQFKGTTPPPTPLEMKVYKHSDIPLNYRLD